MGRIAVPEVEKIRKQIIALCMEDFDALLRDMQIIQEVREEMAAQGEAGAPK